ncbi:MAG: nitrite reductase [Betaproteobacteria bacterium HGW-Betaproteobacteria-3]|jgi:sulfite reductase (NADPH) hemoprotein beta-component|nr:MAG: nitrite reductase [Betaproteobacteria bacterium HGW-Betaproteobacteria-3]
MYQYTEFDRQFVRLRAAQYRDQLQRNQAGTLTDDDFKPLRLQNGWYIQRYAPMLRVAVPYGEVSSAQLRVLATIARDFDQPDAALLQGAVAAQARLGTQSMPTGYGHFTTRQNVQYNWIPLDKSADVMDLLASVDMHGIQTSGNCIRNITSDERAGIAVDEIADPRPFAEILRQWSTLHPEFAFLPRKFKIAITGATEDRAATAWHDVGLHVVRSQGEATHGVAKGAVGFRVLVGGGMGRTPVIGTVVREFLPWQQIMNYLEAVVRVYNRWGRRDNMYKARIKILVKAEGQRYIDEVEAEYRQIIERDGAPHTITQAEFDRVAASFVPPALVRHTTDAERASAQQAAQAKAQEYSRWLQQNVAPHQNPALRAVTLSFKRLGQAPGDATADQLDIAAGLAERFSAGEARVTHDQNLLLPWVHADDLPALWLAARDAGLARPNIRLLTDMIACPGGDFCSLANARSIPVAAAITERFQDLDELFDLGEIDLHISGCINSCGHHHSGHIGILGVDKDGQEWYQVTLGGSDGSALSGAPTPGKVVGPSFSAAEVPDVIEAVLDQYRRLRLSTPNGKAETFAATLQRVGAEPFKQAANAARTPQKLAA